MPSQLNSHSQCMLLSTPAYLEEELGICASLVSVQGTNFPELYRASRLPWKRPFTWATLRHTPTHKALKNSTKLGGILFLCLSRTLSELTHERTTSFIHKSTENFISASPFLRFYFSKNLFSIKCFIRQSHKILYKTSLNVSWSSFNLSASVFALAVVSEHPTEMQPACSSREFLSFTWLTLFLPLGWTNASWQRIKWNKKLLGKLARDILFALQTEHKVKAYISV